MFDFLKNLFKKKSKSMPETLEKAKELNLITEEEFLELKVNRAMVNFENFKESHKNKK